VIIDPNSFGKKKKSINKYLLVLRKPQQQGFILPSQLFGKKNQVISKFAHDNLQVFQHCKFRNTKS